MCDRCLFAYGDSSNTRCEMWTCDHVWPWPGVGRSWLTWFMVATSWLGVWSSGLWFVHRTGTNEVGNGMLSIGRYFKDWMIVVCCVAFLYVFTVLFSLLVVEMWFLYYITTSLRVALPLSRCRLILSLFFSLVSIGRGLLFLCKLYHDGSVVFIVTRSWSRRRCLLRNDIEAWY